MNKSHVNQPFGQRGESPATSTFGSSFPGFFSGTYLRYRPRTKPSTPIHYEPGTRPQKERVETEI